MKTFLKVILVILVMGGAAYGSIVFMSKDQKGAPAAQGGGGRGSEALRSRAYQVTSEPISWNVSAVGTILANEAVDLVSEQSRRLMSVHFEDGQRVKAGDLLFKLDTRDLEARQRELEAQLELAKLNRDRVKNLVRSQASAEAEFDTLNASVQVLEAQIESVRTEIDKASIVAPFDGHIGLRRVSAGAFLSPSTVLATLQDDSRVKVDFRLPERYAAQIRIGVPFRFRVETSSEWKEISISAVEPKIEVDTRSLFVRGEADNSEGSLFPGAFVQVELAIVQKDDAILIPAQALVPSANGSSVFVFNNGKAEVRPVTAGNRTSDRIEILSGLKEGDIVLITNLLRLRDGSSVELEQEPAAG